VEKLALMALANGNPGRSAPLSLLPIRGELDNSNLSGLPMAFYEIDSPTFGGLGPTNNFPVFCI
jgi:hypothetical protein